MWSCVLLLAAAIGLRAGVIQGVVIEQVSGRPLARALVQLEPVPGSGEGMLKPVTTRAGRGGHFVFSGVRPGLYLLTATNEGYFPAANGQRRPAGRGTPIPVSADSDFFTELRLHHKGALTGRVLDENGVGTAGVPVMAYRARLPLRSAGNAKTDDRGVYRIAGLEPGKYWVRTAAHTLVDGSGWLPTFGPQGRETRDARTYQVMTDADTSDADISPEAGVLFHLSGVLQCEVLGPVNVALSSETGRKTQVSNCPGRFRFDGLAPGVYEVFARMQDGSASGFTELFIDRASDAAAVLVHQVPTVNFDVLRGGAYVRNDRTLKMMGRRQELSESEEPREIRLPATGLDPGHWELRAIAPGGQYVESIGDLRPQPRRLGNVQPSAEWFEVFIQPRFPSRIFIRVADGAAQITARAMIEGKPAPGVPVFLWPVDETARRTLGGFVQALSNVDGKVSFENLPPGDYRLLATLDVSEVDADLIDLSQAETIHTQSRQNSSVDLTVWLAP